jgi:hypothetical protein
MRERGLRQKEFAPALGIDPTTLNNFLNRQSKSLNGLTVALACTILDLTCNGARIGRIVPGSRTKQIPKGPKDQLVLEFDESFRFLRKSDHPAVVLRKSPSRDVLRLSVKRIG